MHRAVGVDAGDEAFGFHTSIMGNNPSKSMGNNLRAFSFPAGHIPSMQEHWKNRIVDRLAELKLDMKAASRLAGKNETFVRDILKRDRSPSVDAFFSLSRALQVSPEWLLIGIEETQDGTDFRRVPLISRTAAGGLEYRQGIHPADIESFLTVSGLGKGDWFALVVDGDSMDRIAPDGSTIFVNRAEFEPMDGKPYIFATTDENKTTFKLWDQNGWLLPFSMNPEHRPIAIHEQGVRCIGRVRNVFRTLD